MKVLYKYLTLSCFFPVVRVTTAWFKCCLSANISICDGTTWQCWMPHYIVIHWKLCMPTIFPLCCHVPVQQNAWRKPNGLNFRNTGCQRKECCFIKFNFNPFCFPFMISNKLNEYSVIVKWFFSWLKHKVYKWFKVWDYHSISFHFLYLHTSSNLIYIGETRASSNCSKNHSFLMYRI